MNREDVRDILKLLLVIAVVISIALIVVWRGDRNCENRCSPDRYLTIGRELTCLCMNPNGTIYFPINESHANP